MQPASSHAFPEPPLAVMWQLSGNSRLGFGLAGNTLHRGLNAGKYLIAVGDTNSLVRNPWLESFKDQQQNGSSGGKGFWHWLGHGLSNWFHGDSWSHMREVVTHRILPAEPNGYVTAATDAAGLIAPVAGKAGKVLGPAGSIINFANDPSPKSAVMNGLPFLVPETGVPLAIYGAAEDGSGFVANHMIIPVFTPDASQAGTIGDGNGHSIPNPAMMDGSELIP